jgi:hypothetical protein
MAVLEKNELMTAIFVSSFRVEAPCRPAHHHGVDERIGKLCRFMQHEHSPARASESLLRGAEVTGEARELLKCFSPEDTIDAPSVRSAR